MSKSLRHLAAAAATLFLLVGDANAQLIEETFEKGYDRWNTHLDGGQISLVEGPAGKVVSMRREQKGGDQYTRLVYRVADSDLPKLRGKRVTVMARVKAQSIEPGVEHRHAGHIDLEIGLSSGMDWRYERLSGSFDWKDMTLNWDIPTNATSIALRIGIQGAKGTISFDNVRLALVP